MFLRFVMFTFWKYYILKLIRLETITFNDATLSDINVVWCYVYAVPLKQCTVRKKYFLLDRPEQPRQNSIFLYRLDKPQRTNQASVGNPFIKKKYWTWKEVSQDFGLQVARNHPWLIHYSHFKWLWQKQKLCSKSILHCKKRLSFFPGCHCQGELG